MAQPLQETKIFNAIPPAGSQDNAAFSSLVIDKLDLDGAIYLEFIVALGTLDADLATLKVMESDTKTDATTLGGTPAEVVDGLTNTTPGDSDDKAVAVLGVDLGQSRKRYLQLQATAGDGASGSFLAAVAIASRPITAGSSAATRGSVLAEYA